MDLLENIVVNLLSDTYTLIVGFVAIGIPLALQMAVNASEKYDNALVIKRLTTGWIINPITLILFSTIYVTLSLSLEVAFPELSKFDYFVSHYLTEIRSTLGGVFISIIIGAGYFYIRFYYRVLQSTEKYIDGFLFPNTSLVPAIYWLNGALTWRVFSILVDKIESKKIAKKDFKSINAGLEVLITQLEEKSWEKRYIDILFKFNCKIRKAYLKEFKKSAPKLSPSDILIIKMYWDALIRIVKLSRGNQDTKLSFHSQRLLSSLAVNFIHHPQYNDIASSNFSTTTEEKINWSHDLYELARWQSQQDSKGIDLVLECEWIRDLCGVLAEPDYRYSRAGTMEAFKTFENILELVAQNHPNKIFNVYKNFSEGMPSFHGYDHFPAACDKDTVWINDFWASFDRKNFSLEGDDKVSEELLSLKDGRAYIKHASYGMSRPLTEQEVVLEWNRLNYKEIYKKSYLDYCGFLALKFVAILAYFQKWNELKYCLEWAKPRDSQVNYIGNVLLASTDKEIERIIFSKFETINNNHWFFERHDILPFVCRGLLFQLVFYYEKTGDFSHFFTSGGLSESRKQTRILELLINQQQFIEYCGVFDSSLISRVVSYLKDSLANLESRTNKLLVNCEPSASRWEQFKIAIEEGWHTKATTDPLANMFLSMLNFKFTEKICPVEIKLVIQEFPKEDFIEGFPSVANNEIFGEIALDRTLHFVYEEIKRKAVEKPGGDINPTDKALVIASAAKLAEMGVNLHLKLIHDLH
ncbi:hypothetical protein [Thalassotalea sp. PS06]|uniref:hypothetical protein n=1 Tax=Thalassotalea sp. PS06 TaxID=2594005 RepID=UPI001161CCDD|nr:hypothetical protein [Thalassotalea sp. PS06]QDP02212.1 hypothetical protein FNC98_13210 [Thalassotalea sp. PS06]